MKAEITVYDHNRLESYSKNMVDFHLIIDLVPRLAKMYFMGHFKQSMRLSFMHSAILLGIGLQYKIVDEISVDLRLQVSEVLPQFIKIVKKFARVFDHIYKKEIEDQMPRPDLNADISTLKSIKEPMLEELTKHGEELVPGNKLEEHGDVKAG